MLLGNLMMNEFGESVHNHSYDEKSKCPVFDSLCAVICQVADDVVYIDKHSRPNDSASFNADVVVLHSKVWDKRPPLVRVSPKSDAPVFADFSRL